MTEPMPEFLRVEALKAKARTEKRGLAPPLGNIWRRQYGEDRDYLANPYSEDQWELWVCLLLDAFGTRSHAVAHAFMKQLATLCPEDLDGERKVWLLNNETFQQALSIVRSFRPRNEAEAAMAVQAVATFQASMKLAEYVSERTSLDPQTASAIAALNRTYAQQLATMSAMRGGKTKRQVIKVEKHVHLHNEKHVHLPSGGGCSNNTGQPYAPTAQRAHATPVELTALPCPDAGGEVLSGASRAGEAGLSNARRSQGKRSAEG